MRKASQDYHFWMDGGVCMGVSLGFDFTAEHEWGIEDMKRKFGISESSKKNMGIKCRTITKVPDKLIFREEEYKGKKFAVLFVGEIYTDKNGKEHLPSDLDGYQEDILFSIKWTEEQLKRRPESEKYEIRHDIEMVSAWDGGTFGIGVIGEEKIGYLKELYMALQKKNMAIASVNLSPGNPFSNSSLSLLILDRIPKESMDLMYMADKKHYDLIDYEKKIGMTKIKEKSKKSYQNLHYYLACSPKWINYEDPIEREEEKYKLNTKYDIQYWINYSDDDNNFGWYTVEEIKKWLTGDKKLTEIRRAYNPEVK